MHHSPEAEVEAGPSMVEYIVGSAVILLTFLAFVWAWQGGLADKVGNLVQQLR